MGALWSEQRKEIVRTLWADGLSASQIAHQLGGVTRNAVLGVVHRMGLSGRVVTVRKKPTDWRIYQKSRAQRATHNATHFLAIAVNLDPGFTEQLRPDDQNIPAEQRKSFAEIENHHCHWPVGDPSQRGFFFCGDPTADLLGGRPYCRGHAARAFTTPAPRPRTRYADNQRSDARRYPA